MSVYARTETVWRVVQRVAELPDRTSPHDWPEAMLVTAPELSAIVAEEVLALLTERAQAEQERDEAVSRINELEVRHGAWCRVERAEAAEARAATAEARVKELEAEQLTLPEMCPATLVHGTLVWRCRRQKGHTANHRDDSGYNPGSIAQWP